MSGAHKDDLSATMVGESIKIAIMHSRQSSSALENRRIRSHLAAAGPVFSARAPYPRSRRPAVACKSVGQIAGARSCLGKVKISIARAACWPSKDATVARQRHAGAPRGGKEELRAAYYDDNRKSSPHCSRTDISIIESRTRSIPIARVGE